MSCPQIWKIEQRKDRKKEKVGGRPAKLNEKPVSNHNVFMKTKDYHFFLFFFANAPIKFKGQLSKR